MSAVTLIADEYICIVKGPLMTQSGLLLSPIGVTAFDPDEMYRVVAAFHGI
jgi:hypothetical protein